MVAQGFKEFRRTCFGRLENIARQLAVVRALLNDDKIVDFSQLLPDLSELCQHQFSEQRADADVSKVITFAANRAAARGIISVLRMIKRLLHKPGECLRPAIPNLGSYKLNQGSVSHLRFQV